MGHRTTKVGKTYMPLGKIIYIMFHGEYDKDQILCYKDGNKQNVNIDNLFLTSKSVFHHRKKLKTKYYKGVNKCGKKFAAEIVIDTKVVRTGYYDTPEEAHKAYCIAAVKQFGKDAVLF